MQDRDNDNSCDLFVIGAGSGGVRAARISASLGAKVIIAEGLYLGGTSPVANNLPIAATSW